MNKNEAETTLKLINERLNSLENSSQIYVSNLATSGAKLDAIIKEKKNLLKAKAFMEDMVNPPDDLSCGNCCCDGVCT